MPKLIKNINKKVVVFDLDETLGYFGELGRFCNILDEYYKKISPRFKRDGKS